MVTEYCLHEPLFNRPWILESCLCAVSFFQCHVGHFLHVIKLACFCSKLFIRIPQVLLRKFRLSAQIEDEMPLSLIPSMISGPGALGRVRLMG